MKTLLPIIVALDFGLIAAAAPAAAQQSPPPPQNQVVGPPQISGFSLNGTVTKSAPAPVQAPPVQSRPSEPARDTSPAPARAGKRKPSPPAIAPVVKLAPQAPAPSTRMPRQPLDQPQEGQTIAIAPQPSQSLILPFLIAALAVAGAAAWFLFRRRPAESFAGAAGVAAFDTASAEPESAPAPAPIPARSKPPSGGIVSIRMRPWLDVELVPERAIVDDSKATVQFRVALVNSGNAPARDVSIEAAMFSAGADQDRQIRGFFDRQPGQSERIALIMPLQTIALDTAVFLPRQQVQPIEIEGRSLFVPMIAVNALYVWGGGKGRTSSSFLVGRTTRSDKLAPFRLDLGPRIFRNLDARRHELGVRS